MIGGFGRFRICLCHVPCGVEGWLSGLMIARAISQRYRFPGPLSVSFGNTIGHLYRDSGQPKGFVQTELHEPYLFSCQKLQEGWVWLMFIRVCLFLKVSFFGGFK